MGIKIGINGFGRIGRNVLRACIERGGMEEVECVIINDHVGGEVLGHLFKYDSILGNYEGEVEYSGGKLRIDGREIWVTRKEFEELEWGGVDVVVESTGLYTDGLMARRHLDFGAKKVIVSAPGKNEDMTIVLGVNEKEYDSRVHHVISNASCTTNCLAPVVKVLEEGFGVEKGIMTTVHSYTNDQRILDQGHKDLRRSRAAGLSMIPTTTGAASAVGVVIPEVRGRLTGMAIRVPTPNVSLVDLSIILKSWVSKDDLHAVIRKKCKGELEGILEYCEEPLVSIDFRGNSHSGVFDSLATEWIEGGGGKSNFFKLLVWYDNEWGYSCRIVDLVRYLMGSS